MGKKFAPAYTNIFMAEWEEGALQTAPQRPLYYRYLDDIWRVWQYPKEDFQAFIDHMNNHNSSIKIKATLQDGHIDFLHITFKRTRLPSYT